MLEKLIAWKEAEKGRHFLIRSRMSGGYWIEVHQGCGKFEIQAKNELEIAPKVEAAMARFNLKMTHVTR